MKRGPRLLDVDSHAHVGAGVLHVLSVLPFSPERMFWISAPRRAIRGKHAHRTNEQVVVLVSGDMLARCVWWSGGHKHQRRVHLTPGQALLLPAMVWLEMCFRATGVCVVLASEPYDAASYVHRLADLRRLS